MRLNADFAERAVVRPDDYEWVPSPMPGVERMMLDRVGDEHGLYPRGTYVRNPIGTRHTPRVGDAGCTIFVKLHQFDKADQQPVTLDTNEAAWSPGLVPGLQVMSLHEHGTEHVALVKWAPHTEFQPHTHWGGEEILVGA
jgi:anti-sigma factor ChrR (cupin superfamily)